jgi:hypothetical protein
MRHNSRISLNVVTVTNKRKMDWECSAHERWEQISVDNWRDDKVRVTGNVDVCLSQFSTTSGLGGEEMEIKLRVF